MNSLAANTMRLKNMPYQMPREYALNHIAILPFLLLICQSSVSDFCITTVFVFPRMITLILCVCLTFMNKWEHWIFLLLVLMIFIAEKCTMHIAVVDGW